MTIDQNSLIKCIEKEDYPVIVFNTSVPNRRVGRNKRAGGKILRKH